MKCVGYFSFFQFLWKPVQRLCDYVSWMLRDLWQPTDVMRYEIESNRSCPWILVRTFAIAADAGRTPPFAIAAETLPDASPGDRCGLRPDAFLAIAAASGRTPPLVIAADSGWTPPLAIAADSTNPTNK